MCDGSKTGLSSSTPSQSFCSSKCLICATCEGFLCSYICSLCLLCCDWPPWGWKLDDCWMSFWNSLLQTPLLGLWEDNCRTPANLVVLGASEWSVNVLEYSSTTLEKSGKPASMSLPSIMEDHSWFSLSSIEKSAVTSVCFPAPCWHPSCLNPDWSSSFSALTVKWRPLLSAARWLELYVSPNSEVCGLETSERLSWWLSWRCWLSEALVGWGYCKADPVNVKRNEMTQTMPYARCCISHLHKTMKLYSLPPNPTDSLIHNVSFGLSSFIVNETVAPSISENYRGRILNQAWEMIHSSVYIVSIQSIQSSLLDM